MVILSLWWGSPDADFTVRLFSTNFIPHNMAAIYNAFCKSNLPGLFFCQKKAGVERVYVLCQIMYVPIFIFSFTLSQMGYMYFNMHCVSGAQWETPKENPGFSQSLAFSDPSITTPSRIQQLVLKRRKFSKYYITHQKHKTFLGCPVVMMGVVYMDSQFLHYEGERVCHNFYEMFIWCDTGRVWTYRLVPLITRGRYRRVSEKKNVTLSLTHWSYVFLALTHHCVSISKIIL